MTRLFFSKWRNFDSK